MRFWLVIFTLISLAGPALADIDQHCLALCTNAGLGAPSCLTQCTYNITPKLKMPGETQSMAASPETHRVLAVPLPGPENNALLLKPATVHHAAVQEDRACLASCHQAGMQNGLCQERCAKPECPLGHTQCLGSTATSLTSQFDFKH